jgi:peptide/nickel transport system permease protein
MNSRLRFVTRRLLQTVPVLFAMSVFVFLIIRLVPGDPVRTMLGFRATPANVAEIRRKLGLDQSLITQYGHFIGGLFHGDFGTDFISRAPLSQLLAQRLPVTLELTVLALGLAIIAGIPLGILAATGSRWLHRFTDGFVIAGISVTDFWLGIMLVQLFSVAWVLLPPSGYVPLTEDPVQNLKYMTLPVLTLAVAETAYILRTTRGAMESVLGQPFVTFLRAKGISHRRIVYRHAFKNAAGPVVTVIGIQFGVLLGGAIVIETLFALPGIGRLLVTAINQRNYPVVQAGVLVVAALFIFVSLLTDLIVGWLDPRIADGKV